jgi:hypothetical protein
MVPKGVRRKAEGRLTRGTGDTIMPGVYTLRTIGQGVACVAQAERERCDEKDNVRLRDSRPAGELRARRTAA